MQEAVSVPRVGETRQTLERVETLSKRSKEVIDHAQDAGAWSRMRGAFPVLREGGYWNSGTCGPLPLRSLQALQEAQEQELLGGRSAISGYLRFLKRQAHLHALLAALLGAAEEEVIWTQNTTEGMNIVLWGLPWQAGDQILTSDQEHMGLLAPLAQIHRRFGVEVRYLPFRGDAQEDAALLEQAISPRTRLVALSHVSYLDGRRFAIEAVGAMCRARGIPLLVDAAQSLGVFPLDVKALQIDFLAAPCQKWLCGPEGTGVLFVDRAWQSRLQPTFVGTFSMRNAGWYDQTAPYYVPTEGAGRYLAGGRFRPLLEGLVASLEFLETEVGWPWIFARIAAMVPKVRAALESLEGVSVVTPAGKEASLLAFRMEGVAPAALMAVLEKEGMILRSVPANPPSLRVSVGFFHDTQDIERLCEALQRGAAILRESGRTDRG